jgi:gamma-glutamylputrescine oxidase
MPKGKYTPQHDRPTPPIGHKIAVAHLMHITHPLDIDDNQSLWATTAHPVDSLKILEGALRADVVIIGAGFTGLSTAYHLSSRFPQRKIVVLEARRVGNGASGRNGGMALHWINGVEIRDADRARRLYSVTTETLQWIQDVAREHNFPLRFRRNGCLEIVTNTQRAEEAHENAEKLASWGLPIQFLQGKTLEDKLRAKGAVGATFDSSTGQLHGLDLLHGLRGVLLARGVEIYENSPVVRIEEGREHVVTTPKGSVRAPTMVLGTNGYTGSLGYFRSGIIPMHSHCVATEPLPLERWRELGWGDVAAFSDDLDRIAYASLTDDGRLLFGGGGNGAYSYYYGGKTSVPRVPEGKYAFVKSVLDRYFPGARDVRIAQRWTGTLGVTLSRVCAMGVTGAHKNVFYALGYSGHGVVLANLAGRVLCDLYSDHHEPWRDMPFYQKLPGGIPPEPLRWLGYHAFTTLTGRSPRRYEAHDKLVVRAK